MWVLNGKAVLGVKWCNSDELRFAIMLVNVGSQRKGALLGAGSEP
jgi:hypothetical protein